MVKFGQELGRHTATSPVGPEKYVDYSKIKKSLKQTDITNDKLQEMFEAEMNKVSETIAREPETLTSDPDYVTINEKALDKISKKIDKHRNLDRRTKNRELASSNLKQSLLGAGDTETVQIEQNADGDVNYTNPMADATIAEEVGDDAKEEVGGVAGVVQWFVEQKYFLAVVALAFLVALLTYQTLEVAMWVGVSFAAYSAVANDSIQTLGILMAASKDTAWYILWAYVSAIFLGTVGVSWVMYDGDVSHQRLSSKGFDEAPTRFEYLQVAAPIFLLILTRLRMPVSTTFLLLSCFASSAGGFWGLVIKSLSGYVIAFLVSSLVFFGFGQKMQDAWHDEEGEPTSPAPYWLPLLWVSAGFLWSVWLMQNAANIAVYLPRNLSWWQFIMFCTPIVGGLGVVMHMGGDKVQEIVEEKSGVGEIRSAAIINIVYGAILFFFQTISKVPMSTTWVFVGLLAGRELALCKRGISGLTLQETGKLVLRDVVYVTIGFVVSVVIAAASNPVVRNALF